MRKIFKSVLAITLSTIFAFPAQAATMESIANADSRFHYDGTTLTATIKSAEIFPMRKWWILFLTQHVPAPDTKYRNTTQNTALIRLFSIRTRQI